jgi:hypothetical protein
MKKNFKHIESRGLPGGPNEQFTYITGVFSIDGYKSDSPDVNNPFNVIPSGNITTKGVDFDLIGMDNLGNVQYMKPGKDYEFPGDIVFEVPAMKLGGGGRCWPGYTPVPGKKAFSPGSCRKAQYGGNSVTEFPMAQEGAGVNKEGVEQYKWFKNYMRSPKYVERLKKEFPDYTDKQIGQEVKSRLENVMQTRVGFLPFSSDISPSLGSIQGVYNTPEYPGAIMLRPEYSASTSDEIFEPGNYLGDYTTIPLHEWSHAADDGGNRIPQSTTDLMLSKMKENFRGIPKDKYYYTTPTEYLGRMQPLRYLMQKEGLYDAGTQDFTKEDLEKAKQNKTIKNNVHFQNLMENVKSDEDFIELMNKVASVNQKDNSKTLMAKQGKAQDGIELDQAQLGTFIKKVIKPALKTGSKYLDDLFKSTDNIDDLVEVVTANGLVKKIPRKDAIKLNRVEDANVTNTSFTNYEDGNWFADDLSDFYVNRTKNAMTPVSYDLLDPKDPRRLITMYMDPSDAKNFNLTKGTATERALNMSGGVGNMPLPSEYVLPPELVKQIRETGKIPGASTFIGDADQVMKNLTEFYKQYGGDISGLDKAQLGAFLKRLKPAIKKGVNYIDEFIQNDLYKYNPWAYNNINSKLPEFLQLNKNNEKWLRQVGEPAIRDAQVTGTVREMGEEISPRLFAQKLAELQNLQPGMFQLSKRYPGPFFKKGETFFDYNKKSRPGLDGKRNTRGRSGSADYLIEFDPSDPIKYQGMDSYFQPAYMQNMMLDPAPMNKWVGDVGIMKPKMRGVENFNFYKKDPFWAYKKVPLDKLQEGGQAPFDKESWEYYRQQNPEAVMNPPVNDSVVIPPKDGFTKQTFVENLAKPKSELQQNKTLNFNNILDYVVNTRGGTRELWGKAADTIAFHESGPWARMDTKAKQYLGGPGRGLFQFEPPSLKTAQKRYTNIAKLKGFTPNPDILNAKSADELNAQDQYTLFFANLLESKAKLSDYAEGKIKLEDLWLKGHKNVESQGDRDSFLESLKAAEKEGIKGGYTSFEGGGELTLYDIYKKYVMGGATDEVSKSIYDKLNRVHYTDAKGLGMSVPNYILTYVMKSS